MKLVLVLCMFVGLAAAQFGGFGGGLSNFGSSVKDSVGNAANNVRNRLNSVGGILPSPPRLNNVGNFADFLAKSGKKYASSADKILREGVFGASKALVDASSTAFNLGAQSFELGLNIFADLTQLEFLQQLTGNKKSSAGEEKAKAHRRLAPPASGKKLPDSFDWRTQGGVTPVKFQDKCGSCWSFATTGAIEGHVFRKTHQLPVLSEQNLIDCGKPEFGLNGCDGGFQEYALEFVVRQNGIAKGAEYQYVDMQESCKYTDKLSGAKITGFAAIKKADEQTMKEVIATLGPIACSMHGLHEFVLYKQGIYHEEKCDPEEVNHSVLVVGYGTENGKDYWIVKNSWGDSWGEDGYFRILRGTNECGIAMECSYPIV